jgi:hypothetical protein
LNALLINILLSYIQSIFFQYVPDPDFFGSDILCAGVLDFDWSGVENFDGNGDR